jgi:prepilin-type N-terminal cleavage/methylation domain-containing protein
MALLVNSMCRAKKSFTIIELLIVVAIISILAAIAVPNFLEAQTRAKVARTAADMRTMVNGLEAYAVDHNKYPKRHYGVANPEQDTDHFVPDLDTKMEDLSRITTPIAYLTTLPIDIFDRAVPAPLNKIDYYDPIQTYRYVNYLYAEKKQPGYMLLSVGPDGYIGVLPGGDPGGYPPQPPGVSFTFRWVYDPTRGTISMGNILRFQSNEDPRVVMRNP